MAKYYKKAYKRDLKSVVSDKTEAGLRRTLVSLHECGKWNTKDREKLNNVFMIKITTSH